MLLVVDVGNTHIVIGVFKGKKLVADWRITTFPEKTIDEYAVIVSNLFSLNNISSGEISDAIISSVVPPLTHILQDYIKGYLGLKPMVVGEGVDIGLPICCDEPKEVGADRIVNAVAGIEKFGAPLIIVDFGTATTFDTISSKGEYVGGVIAPGMGLSIEALFAKTAKLPKIDIKKPQSVIGKNTVASMESGAFFGYVGLVDGILERMVKETGDKVNIVATGGFLDLIAPESRFIKITAPDLTLEGLNIIYRRNRLT